MTFKMGIKRKGLKNNSRYLSNHIPNIVLVMCELTAIVTALLTAPRYPWKNLEIGAG